MKHIYGHLFALLLMALGVSVCHASDTDYSFIPLSPFDGYPSEVTSIFVQENGFAWVGSPDGLYRIENTTYTRYTSDFRSGNSPVNLPGNYIYKVYGDGHDILWALTDNGLIGYDCTRLIGNPQPVRPDSLLVAYCCLEMDDCILFGGDDIVWKYDYAGKIFSELAHIDSGAPYPVRSLHMLANGRVLVFTDTGQLAYEMIPSSGRLEPSFYEMTLHASVAFVDSQYRLWLGYRTRGIDSFDPAGRLLCRYDSSTTAMTSDHILCFAEREGLVWAGTEGGGIVVIDPREETLQEMRQRTRAKINSIPGSTFTDLFVDKNNTVWAGRNKGGTILVKNSIIRQFKVSDMVSLKSEGILSVFQSSYDDYIWFGTDCSGIIRIQPDTEALKIYPKIDGFRVYSMADYDEKHLIISALSKGILLFDKETGDTEPLEGIVDNERFISEGGPICLINEPRGTILIIADKLYRYDPETRSVDSFDVPAYANTSTLHSVFGSDGKFFFDNYHLMGWDKFGESLEIISEFDANKMYSCAAIDRSGNIYLGCEREVYRYNIDKHTMEVLDIDIHDDVQTLAFSLSGRLWIGTMNAIYAYYPSTGGCVLLGEMDGAFRNQYMPHATYSASNGDLLMGGLAGVLKISSDVRFVAGREPEINLLDVTTDGRVQNNVDRLVIRSYDKATTIRFIVYEDDILRKKLYRFWVNRFGEQPRMYEKDEPSITLASMPAGRYTVSAACTTIDGSWTEEKEILTFRVQAPAYKTFWFWILVIALFGIPVGTVLYHRQKLLKSQALLSSRQADAEHKRANFLIDVSHELQTPLMLIIGPLERILKKMPSSDENYEKLQNIDFQANRMRSLITTVMDANKIELGIASLYPEQCNFNFWASKIVEAFEDEASGRGIRIKKILDPDVNVVEADTDKLENVITNLMINAMKHSPDDSQLMVGTEFHEDEDTVRFFVSDRGPGLCGADPEKLFERYKQGAQEKSGSGIGLAFANSVVKLHGGRMGAFDNPIGGSTFYFDIPATQPKGGQDNE